MEVAFGKVRVAVRVVAELETGAGLPSLARLGIQPQRDAQLVQLAGARIGRQRRLSLL